MMRAIGTAMCICRPTPLREVSRRRCVPAVRAAFARGSRADSCGENAEASSSSSMPAMVAPKMGRRSVRKDSHAATERSRAEDLRLRSVDLDAHMDQPMAHLLNDRANVSWVNHDGDIIGVGHLLSGGVEGLDAREDVVQDDAQREGVSDAGQVVALADPFAATGRCTDPPESTHTCRRGSPYHASNKGRSHGARRAAAQKNTLWETFWGTITTAPRLRSRANSMRRYATALP